MMFFMRCFRAGYRINSRDDKKNDAKILGHSKRYRNSEKRTLIVSV